MACMSQARGASAKRELNCNWEALCMIINRASRTYMPSQLAALHGIAVVSGVGYVCSRARVAAAWITAVGCVAYWPRRC